MSHAIELTDVHRRLGKSFEIRDLSMKLPAGSIYGFLGPNGAGKTTTIRIILGLLRAERGTVRVLDRTIPEEAPRALRAIGYVPESPHLYPSLTVQEALDYHAAFYDTWDRAHADELVSRFRLDRTRGIDGLSKGETGQLMMLMALAQRPELLVLDEPTDALDPLVRRDLLMALLDYVSDRSVTILISSHLVHELERVCDWVGVVDRGRMVAEMPMQTFKSGIKRLRVQDAPVLIQDPPFHVLARETPDALDGGEVWVVRGWQDSMTPYFDGVGATLREVVDLDLEEAFVELLRTARGEHRGEG